MNEKHKIVNCDQAITVSITTPARLHMGFVDMSGDLGRHFGGLGLTLSDINTQLTVSRSAHFSASGPSAQRALIYAKRSLQELGLNEGVHIEIKQAIPEHVGLGSGTQLALAVSFAIACLFGVDTNVRTLANLMQRGTRSGVGLGAFEFGGFIVDGGRSSHTKVPPIICQMPFPETWQMLLIFDHTHQGLNGKREVNAFKSLPPMQPSLSARLCRLVLMQVLPALAEQDFDAFSRGITAIQEAVGDYFSGFQGGRYSSPRVAQVLEWLKRQGIAGVGQSSWGPTGFALVEGVTQASQLLQVVSSRWGTPLSFKVCKARNTGADILIRKGDSAGLLSAYYA